MSPAEFRRLHEQKFNRPRDVQTVAAEFRCMIAWEALRSGLTVCDLEAEILAQSLMSDDCDQCHVHWLELHSKLEEKLQNANS